MCCCRDAGSTLTAAQELRPVHDRHGREGVPGIVDRGFGSF